MQCTTCMKYVTKWHKMSYLNNSPIFISIFVYMNIRYISIWLYSFPVRKIIISCCIGRQSLHIWCICIIAQGYKNQSAFVFHLYPPQKKKLATNHKSPHPQVIHNTLSVNTVHILHLVWYSHVKTILCSIKSKNTSSIVGGRKQNPSNWMISTAKEEKLGRQKDYAKQNA